MASSDSNVSVNQSSSDEHEEEASVVRGGRRGRGRPRGRTAGGTRGRSRGSRSRGRPRGRGRGRGRSSSGGISLTDRERVRQRREERVQQTRELIRRLDPEQLREMVLDLVNRQPGLVFDLCERAADPDPDQPHPGPQPGQSPSWCRCGNCVEMPTELERKCCDCLQINCVSLRLEMETLVLDPQVLGIGNQYYRDMLGRYGQVVDDYNKSMRHAAYRNFVLWRHGRLGAGVRRVIPACCVKRIRQSFPDSMNNYTGFVPNRLI